ncbi:N-acetylglucosamine-6-phosphate deacetylase [Stieleria sp. TO1_6]|uniref:N-acetylglucosamine-6-phosphate deacetylase n=1 Tax=Stieleria tagensis TaxID=2956795 RepID=UPI00209AFED1|nr:N-acetylglucosamine-6-phosphate deacetylase [Stieleria tagensis]MCO8124068.1 N-acetylglucosamine-6-phosphate deacetylase [Stieleria tagensis]
MSGSVDLQVNGYAGVDFNDDTLTETMIAAACLAMRDDGVKCFLPTIITDDLGLMVRRITRIADAVESDALIAESIAGIHVEGPFISSQPGFVGAHPSGQVVAANVDQAMRLLDAGRGLVRLFTLAPEVGGAVETTARLTRESVVVAAGHSDATIDQMQATIDVGLKMYTHLGNGCPAQLHRHDNIVQRVLSLADQLVISLIADGHHVPWFALANYLRCIPDQNVVIVTDAISAAGLGPGKYRLAGQTVEVDDDLAAWAEGREHFAGCATTMPQMITMLRGQLGLQQPQIDRWTSHNPARVLEID